MIHVGIIKTGYDMIPISTYRHVKWSSVWEEKSPDNVAKLLTLRNGQKKNGSRDSCVR